MIINNGNDLCYILKDNCEKNGQTGIPIIPGQQGSDTPHFLFVCFVVAVVVVLFIFIETEWFFTMLQAKLKAHLAANRRQVSKSSPE